MFRRQPQIPLLHLSFDPPAIAVTRRLQWILLLTTLVSFGLTLLVIQESRSLDEQAEGHEGLLARQHRATQLLDESMARAGLTLSNEQIAAVRKEIAFANELTEKRDFSWTEMLHNLEEGLPPRVSIRSVRLNFKDSTILLHGTVKTMQDLDALVTKLNRTETFSRVGLAEHAIHTSTVPAFHSTNVAETGPVKDESSDVIDFTLTVTYHQTF